MTVVPIDERRGTKADPGGRVPPSSIPTEEHLLGAVLISRDALAAVSAETALAAEDFYKPTHGHIWDAVHRCYDRGDPTDTGSVADELARAGLLDAVGGPTALITLQSGTPATTSAIRYARIVHDYSLLRRMIGAAGDIAEIGFSVPTEVDGAVDQAEQLIYNLRRGDTTSNVEAFTDGITAYLDSLEDGDEITGAPTGLYDLDEIILGLSPGQLIVIGGRPAMGKAQPVDTPVLTPTGWCPIGDVKPGDLVVGVDGQPTTVVAVHPQGRLPVYRVSLSDRTSTRTCGDHFWLVQTHHDRVEGKRGRLATTAEIREELAAGRARHHHLPIVAPVGHPTADLPVDPYLLGLLIGDGCLRGNTPTFTSVDDELHSAVADLVEPPVFVKTGRLDPRTVYLTCGKRGGTPNPLTIAIEDLGLWGHLSRDKFIPESYKHADVEQRLAVLQGIMDTDGWYSRRCCQLATASQRLAVDVAEVVRSLGGVARLRFKDNPHAGAWHVHFRLAPGLCPFRLSRKREPWEADRSTASRPPDRKIVAVEPAGAEECVCITVDADEQLYVTEQHIVTHNSSLAGQIAINVASAGLPVLFVSGEMSRTELYGRWLSNLARVDLERIRRRRLVQKDWERINTVLDQLQALPIDVLDDGNATLTRMRGVARRVRSRRGALGLVVVDYLQLLAPFDAENRQVAVAELSRGCKILARELDVPVVALSQLSRGLEQRGDKRPMLSDLRDSGAIEQDADVVVFVYRDEVYKSDSDDRGVAELIVAKQRNGPIGTAKVGYHAQYGRWANMARGI